MDERDPYLWRRPLEAGHRGCRRRDCAWRVEKAAGRDEGRGERGRDEREKCDEGEGVRFVCLSGREAGAQSGPE